MKYAVIIPAGAVDEAVEELGGRTPLEAANVPALDHLAARGRVGTAVTVPKGGQAGSEVTLLSVLGYDPGVYAAARGPLEAVARGLSFDPKDQVFRCNLVTVTEGRLRDFAAGYIETAQAGRLLDDLNDALEDKSVRFYPGRSFRNLFVWSGAGPLPKLHTADPQGILDEPISKHLPSGPGSEPLGQLIRWSQQVLEEHDVNHVRQDLGENPANCVWVHGQGPLAELPPYGERFGVSAALVAGVDLMRGLGIRVGWEIVDAPGATGLLGTDLAAKAAAVVAGLERHDLVCVHVEAADEAGHAGDVGEKISVLEAIDREVVAPLVRRLEDEPAHRILVMPDHATPVSRRRHSAAPTVFVMAGTGIASNRGEAFDEANAAIGEVRVEQGHELMEYFLRR